MEEEENVSGIDYFNVNVDIRIDHIKFENSYLHNLLNISVQINVAF